MNCLSCEETLPKRVGLPMITASAQSTSSGVASAMSAVAATFAAHCSFEAMASCGASSVTRRSRTSAPAFSAPAAIWRASWVTLPVCE
jgi:hypothetical protein